MTELKCKCGASIPADSQFCPDCGKKINTTKFDCLKWLDSASLYKRKKKFLFKVIKYCIFAILFNIVMVCSIKALPNSLGLAIFMAIIYWALIILVLFFLPYSIICIRCNKRSFSNIKYFENNINSSILIGESYHGNFGLYKMGVFKLKQLLPPQYDRIELIDNGIYKLYKDEEQSLYNSTTKKII